MIYLKPRLIFLLTMMTLTLAGCDLEGIFPCGKPDLEENELEVWSVDLNQFSRTLVFDDFREVGEGPRAHRYDLVGISRDTTMLYYNYEDYSDTTASLRARDLQTGDVIDVGFVPSDKGFTMSPDGSRFAFLRGERELWVANTDGSEALKIAEVSDGRLSEGMWADLDHVAYTPNGQGIHLFSLDEGSTTQLSGADSLFAFDVAPDLTTVAYTRWIRGWNGYDGISVLAYAEDATGVHFLGEGSGDGGRDVIKFASGGDRLVYIGALSQSLILADRDGSNPRIVSEVPVPQIQELLVDPSGEQVLFFERGILKRLNPETGAVSIVQSAQDLPSDESNWDSVTASFEPPVFEPMGTIIYAVVNKRKWANPCDD